MELLGRRAAVVNLPRETADVADLADSPHGYATFRCLLRQAAPAAAVSQFVERYRRGIPWEYDHPLEKRALERGMIL